MKKKIVISGLILVLIFALAYRFSRKSPISNQAPTRQPVNVSTQSADASHTLNLNLQYPAEIKGDQEISITAKAAGNALAVPIELGKQVFPGSLLVRIDDTGNNLSPSDDSRNFTSSQVQTAQLAQEQAKESLSVAKKNYKDLKKAYDDQQNNPALAQTVSKAQVDAAKGQIEIAELQLDSAKVNFKGTLDSHLITSPISGFVIEKDVSVGDSVSVGQKLATISQTKNLKVQFFVSQDQLIYFKTGQTITLTANNGDAREAIIRNISPAADPTTKRFLIEAFPKVQNNSFLASGLVISASMIAVQKPSMAENFLLPLSTITIGQNESYIFIAENSRAKKVNINVVKVQGEAAEIQAEIASDAQIIIGGSKLVQDGDQINVS